MKTRNNIFLDLDGTLLDIESRYVNLFQYMSKIYKINKISSSDFWQHKRNGKTNIQILTQLGYDNNLSNRFHNHWVSLIEEYFWLGFDKLQIDTIEFLNNLNKKNFYIYLITGRNNRQSLLQQLTKLEITHYFENIFNVDTSKMVAQKKYLLEEYKPKLFIGDSEFDYLSCKDLDINFFCVSNGFRNKAFLQKNKIPNILDNLTDVSKKLF